MPFSLCEQCLKTTLHEPPQIRGKLVTPADYPLLRPFFIGQEHPLCAYSLASIIVWANEECLPHITIEDDTLFVCYEFATLAHMRHMLLPISPLRDFTPGELREIAARFGYDTFWFVPEDYVRRHGFSEIAAHFTIEHQTKWDDFVYASQDLSTLRGNRYAKKRNLIHQFERTTLGNGRVRVEPITADTGDECIAFLDRWAVERKYDVSGDLDLQCERDAATKALTHLDLLGLSGLLIRVDGEVAGFGLGGGLTSEMGVFLFEKALSDIKGLYQYFDRACAQHIFAGYEYINKESAMDQPGLAHAKKSYHPVRMVQSYRLTARKG